MVPFVWLVVAVAVGWASAALILYGFGIVLAPLALGVMVYFGWRYRGMSLGVTGFGIGFGAFMVPFLLRNITFLRDPLLVVLAVGGIVLGPIIAVVGIVGSPDRLRHRQSFNQKHDNERVG